MKKRQGSVILDYEKVWKREVAMKRRSDKQACADTEICMKIQKSVNDYLSDKMSLEDAVAFVKHVRSCENCKKEVEKDFLLYNLMRLDELEEKGEKENFSLNIEELLKRTEDTAREQKKNHLARRVTYIVLTILLAAIMGISIGV